jgi:hypothetical protein
MLVFECKLCCVFDVIVIVGYLDIVSLTFA